MEVHHHPKISKKTIQEIFLEAFMIFIAVTMGFFAERIRESISENKKENEYIHSLVKDIEKDKQMLAGCISDNQLKIKGLDSLLELSGADFSKQVNREKLYHLSNYIAYYSTFSSHDITMMQLKNSGGMQYIRRANVSDSIAQYDKHMSVIYLSEVSYKNAIDEALDVESELLTLSRSRVLHEKNQINDYAMLTYDKRNVQILFNKIYFVRIWTLNYIENMKCRIPVAEQLSSFLKREYSVSE